MLAQSNQFALQFASIFESSRAERHKSIYMTAEQKKKPNELWEMWKITKHKKEKWQQQQQLGKKRKKWGTFLRRCFSICNNYWSLRGAKQAAQFPYTPAEHHRLPQPQHPIALPPLKQLLHIFVAYFAADGEHECAYPAQSLFNHAPCPFHYLPSLQKSATLMLLK